jgi:hypothetical protein
MSNLDAESYLEPLEITTHSPNCQEVRLQPSGDQNIAQLGRKVDIQVLNLLVGIQLNRTSFACPNITNRIISSSIKIALW